jgi:PAS domain S-box-containing protein
LRKKCLNKRVEYKAGKMGNKPIKVLLVENNPDDTRQIQGMLAEARGTSFELECADRLSAGLKHLVSGDINVILLDLSLPDSQGIDAFNTVYAQAPSIPVVVLTSSNDGKLASKAVQAGAQDHLVKGQIDSNLLVRSIRYATERQKRLLAELGRNVQMVVASQIRFRHMVQKDADGIVIVDRDGIMQFVNPAAEALFGRRSEELLGELFGFPLVAGETAELDIIRKREKSAVAEMRAVETEWEGKSASLVSLRNITERKRADEGLRKMFESVTDGISVIDLEGVITEVNQRIVEMHGFNSKDELVGKNAFDLVTPGDHKKIASNMRQAIKKGIVKGVEYTLLRADGSEFPAELSTSVITDDSGNAIGHITITRDITERKQAEEALQASIASFHNIVERSADGIVVVDSSGIVRFVNPALGALFGRRAEELLGEMFGLPMISGEITEIDIVSKSGEPRVGEISVIETEWEGEAAHLVSLRDITKRRKAEWELMIKDKAIASSVNAISIANFDGNLTYVNPAFLRMWGYDSDAEVLGKSILEFWPEEEHGQNKMKALYEKRSWQGEIVKKTKNGLELYGQLSISPVIDSDDSPIAIMTSFIDLTERRQLGLKLEEQNKELLFQNEEKEKRAAELAVTNKELLFQNEERKRAEKERERLIGLLQAKVSELEAFSYGIAHDLRSPLVSIEGFSRLLREDLQNQKVENAQEDIRLLESGVRKMQGFINSTLEYSRAGYNIKLSKNVSFGKIVKEVITELNEQMSTAGATVSLAKTFPSVYADKMRIKEVLTNLIQNSIKYRDKTVPMKLEIGHWPSEGKVIFFVHDNGTGIDASEAEEVFTLFYRGTADGEGSGIGLAVVKKIIEAHGGRIWVQQGQSGKGTTMCFTLPKQSGTNKGENNGKD